MYTGIHWYTGWIEKAIGLDIRAFEDAMLFKIAMMVMSHMNYQKNVVNGPENEVK